MEIPNLTSEEFAKKFNFDRFGWENIMLFDNSYVWFSVRKKYPNNILFKPAKTIDWEDDSIAIMRVSYKYKDEINWKVPIYLRISKESNYLLEWHSDYNFWDKKSPTRESLEFSNKTKKPVELESSLEYFYDINKEKFLKD